MLAAGGENNGRFAFGELENPEKEIAEYANTRESGINRTSPVWMYPQGKSPLGVMDMSGNVWEWQANLYGKGGFSPESRSLRGGSWSIHRDYARVSNRNLAHPDSRDNDIGFRVALFPARA
jgi:formylglycine-generating enzyme required for sulfatase activity